MSSLQIFMNFDEAHDNDCENLGEHFQSEGDIVTFFSAGGWGGVGQFCKPTNKKMFANISFVRTHVHITLAY